MLFDKQQIISMISDPQQAEQAAQQLPDQVDHEAHSNLLQQFGVDPGRLAGGGSGQAVEDASAGDPGAQDNPSFQ